MNKKVKMKSKKAWAVLYRGCLRSWYENGRLQFPVFSNKSDAETYADAYLNETSVVLVELRELHSQKKKR